MPTPEETVQATLDAYNAHDLEAYLALFAPEAAFGQLGGRTLLDGREAMRGFYTQMFAARPSIRCRSVERTAMGPYVVDQQEISGEGGPPMEAVMIHEIRDGLVRHIWYAPLTGLPH